MNEPEFEDIEITLDDADRWLGVWHREYRFLPNGFTRLGDLPSLPNFKKFFYAVGVTEHHISFDCIANMISQGNKVYARFRK